MKRSLTKQDDIKQGKINFTLFVIVAALGIIALLRFTGQCSI